MTQPLGPQLQLERDLELARFHGRWLSDDERHLLDQKRLQRRKLAILLGVCLVIPPLWPLAAALAIYLLFPATTQRLAMALGVSLLVVGVLAAGLVAALVVALLMLLS
jgi:hypothetical protein